ncbi:hypothetical protein IEQ34_019238 [Dendrobium chrysotoxum]|uniref:Uncharacterized protein n=1 Tax=Dendrobium chrysotoxum TaxID=161865 RepID=A0AAV7G8A2_DENCH|nr:hypothetical protein IEQ34_019238 [Dendrobium chrysotoxum]
MDLHQIWIEAISECIGDFTHGEATLSRLLKSLEAITCEANQSRENREGIEKKR